MTSIMRRISKRGDNTAAEAPRSPGQRRSRKGSVTKRAAIAVDQELREAFDLLSRETEHGPRVCTDDVGEIIYLVLRQTYSPDRLNAMFRVVDPVHELKLLDDMQCQYIINKIKSQSRANNVLLAGASSRRGRGAKENQGEAESEACCTCDNGGHGSFIAQEMQRFIPCYD